MTGLFTISRCTRSKIRVIIQAPLPLITDTPAAFWWARCRLSSREGTRDNKLPITPPWSGCAAVNAPYWLSGCGASLLAENRWLNMRYERRAGGCGQKTTCSPLEAQLANVRWFLFLVLLQGSVAVLRISSGNLRSGSIKVAFNLQRGHRGEGYDSRWGHKTFPRHGTPENIHLLSLVTSLAEMASNKVTNTPLLYWSAIQVLTYFYFVEILGYWDIMCINKKPFLINLNK